MRYARKCGPDDLWTTYFTSSKYVSKFREEHGEPDVIEVRQIFDDSLQAREWEEKVIRRLDAVRNNKWLNRNNAGKNFYNSDPETLQRMSESRKGIPVSEETRTKLSSANKGRSSHLKGTTLSDEHRHKISKALTGKPSKLKGRPSPKKGISLSEEHKEKLRGPRGPNSKKKD